MLKQSLNIIIPIIIISLFSFFPASHVLSSPAPLEATFKLEQNNPNKNFLATITLKNNSNTPINHWKLALTAIEPIISLDEGTITEQTGGFTIITPNDTTAIIPAKGTFIFHIKGKSNITRSTDTPPNYFLILTNPITHTESTTPIETKIILPAWKPNQGQDENTRTLQKNKTSIEGNAVAPTISLDQSLIIPLPADLKRTKGEFILQPNTIILVDSNMNTIPASAQFFANSIIPATGFHLSVIKNKLNSNSKNTIIFTQKDADKTLGQEGYKLQVSPNKIIITANTEAGFFYAVQSLRQLLPPAIFDTKIVKNTIWHIPCLSIRDYPRFAYRGLSLDVARHFIPTDQIKRLLDLMALHKLNKFQWHLTDDEGWRIEIKKYPSLTTIGAWRGFRRALPPAWGSGSSPYGGYYSQNEIRDILKYAAERHITIIPEIDLPGHARALIYSLPDALKDPHDKSQYTSVQGYHDNVLSPCLNNTYKVLDNIFTEVADLFPSDIIHIGSDEVPKNVWTQSPACQSLMTSLGLKNSDELQNYFLKRVQNIIQSKNKKMAAWEEAINNGDLDKSALIYSWKGEEAGIKAAGQGYSVIMMPAPYLYFDLAYSADPKEPGQTWAGFVDTFKTYSYQPIQSIWTKNIVEKIMGIQGALWSENINSSARLDYLIFPKMLALSEVAWTPKERRNWINFSERVDKLHLQRLDHYGVKYRVSANL